MVNDDERREVARRLRDVEKHAIPDARISDNPMTVEFIAAAVFYDLPYVRGLFSRLADLIDHGEADSEASRKCSDPTLPCDRKTSSQCREVSPQCRESDGHDQSDASAESDRGTHVDLDALLLIADRLDGKAAMLLKLNSTDHSRQRRSVRRGCACDFIMASDLIRAVLRGGGCE